MRTNHPHIFAVGDVNGIHEIVHIAIEQGEIAAQNAVASDGTSKTMDDRLKTSIVFTDPPVAGVGLTEKECREQGIDYLTASHPFDDHGKSICLGETHGHVKLICRPNDGELIGAHIVGPEAGELIHQLIAVMYYHGKVHDLLKMPHYHPTLSEILTYPAEELVNLVKS
jgi:pyruvate/2-oxoglutarate dehydrogenase complex dihydrolipoamide dehydrogenase (E3) component